MSDLIRGAAEDLEAALKLDERSLRAIVQQVVERLREDELEWIDWPAAAERLENRGGS